MPAMAPAEARAVPGTPDLAPATPPPLCIDSRDALARMSPALRRVLRDDFDVGALAAKLCPVSLDDGRVAILTVDAFADSEQIEEFERMVTARRLPLASPSRIVVPATLLLSIARGQITPDTLERRRMVLLDPAKSAMTEAFRDMVAWGVAQGASDIHVNVRLLEAESEIRFTVGGRYVAPERFRRMQTRTLMEILAVAYMDIQGGNGAVFDPVVEQQGSLLHDVEGTPVLLRWASLATDAGPSVTLRILPRDACAAASDFRQLGYLPSQVATMERALLAEGGAIVLAGVVGSGKSTTIAAMMSAIPATRKIITLEDPVEYLIPNALQNSVNRVLDSADDDGFDAKLKTVKRSAMNDLLLGEVRDRATGRAFMDLASSGSNLYATTHAGSAALIADRLASEFIGIPRAFLATPGMLKLLVYQALLPALCDACALPFTALFEGAPSRGQPAWSGGDWRRYAARLETLYDLDATVLRIRNPLGCSRCRRAGVPELGGYAGRTVVAEMIDAATDDAFLRYVRQGDALALREHMAAQRAAPFTAPDMNGKTAMECAVYKAVLGQVDPRDIEPRFTSFETVRIRRERLRAQKEAR